nr:kelch repeat-containing protein [Variovorax sp. HW608]
MQEFCRRVVVINVPRVSPFSCLSFFFVDWVRVAQGASYEPDIKILACSSSSARNPADWMRRWRERLGIRRHVGGRAGRTELQRSIRGLRTGRRDRPQLAQQQRRSHHALRRVACVARGAGAGLAIRRDHRLARSRDPGHNDTLLLGGKVLVAGGFGSALLSSAELYDPATGTWSSTGSMSVGRNQHGATLLPDGKVLVVAGFGASYLSSAELYRP